MTQAPLRIGTRSSPLARWQADFVAGQLRALGHEVEIVFITTQGDVRSGPLGEIGGQGLFTKEIQRALLAEEVDIAVHSLKDLPTNDVAGLMLGAVPQRESVSDVLVSRGGQRFDELPLGAKVGTGSLRRRSQLLSARPDLELSEIRGNVDTRLRKLEQGEYDAIVLAEAGLKRLGLAERITELLPRELILPAVGQGALGIEVRAGDERTRSAVLPLNDEASHAAILAERTLLAELRAGCLAPVGAWARVENGVLQLDAVVLSPDGKAKVAANASERIANAATLGRQVASALQAQGAAELIASVRKDG